jgi:hypothetical protein
MLLWLHHASRQTAMMPGAHAHGDGTSSLPLGGGGAAGGWPGVSALPRPLDFSRGL